MLRSTATRLAATLLLAAAMPAASASANMAAPNQPGDVVGEPQGDLAGLHVEHELLRIDLRPLAQGERALVEAAYTIRNDGPARSVDLVFVADRQEGSEAAVSLDGQPVEFRVAEGVRETAWSPPPRTPALAGGSLPYLTDRASELLFSLEMAPGVHEVTVRYAARAGSYNGSSPTRYWQLGYVLAPARNWQSFGTLDVAVQLPAGWSAASEPPLDRTGDELRGTFEGVPADALAVTAQAPAPAAAITWLSFLAAIVVVFLIGWFIASRGGRFLGARRRSSGWLLPATLIYAFVGAVAIVVVGIGTLGGQYVDATQRSPAYQYTAGFFLILAYPLVFLILAIVLQLVAYRAAGRARPTQAI